MLDNKVYADPDKAVCAACGEALYSGFDPWTKTDWEAVADGRKWETVERMDGHIIHWECAGEVADATK